MPCSESACIFLLSNLATFCCERPVYGILYTCAVLTDAHNCPETGLHTLSETTALSCQGVMPLSTELLVQFVVAVAIFSDRDEKQLSRFQCVLKYPCLN